MKRRGFLGLLGALPFVRKLPAPVSPIEQSGTCPPLQIVEVAPISHCVVLDDYLATAAPCLPAPVLRDIPSFCSCSMCSPFDDLEMIPVDRGAVRYENLD